MNFGHIPSEKRKANIVTTLFGWMSVVRRMQVPVIIRMLDLRQEDIFLDLGCGAGNFAYEMSKRCKCVGVDINPNMRNLGFAKRHQQNLNFMMGDGFNLPFKDHILDKVLLGGTLQAVAQNDKLIKECYRILKEDGILVLSVVQERRAIRMMYEHNKFVTKWLVELFSLPQDYAEFERDYIKRANMTRFYTVEALEALLNMGNFEVGEVEFAPREIGSKLLDALLILSRGLKMPQPNHPIYFPIFYPIVYLVDGLSKDKMKGNELILRAKKVRDYVKR